jgi:hypothetical protein
MIIALAALVTALAMAALAVSLYALYGAQKLCHAAQITMKTVREECTAAIEAAQTQYTVVASELETAKLQPPVEVLPGNPRPSMNVTRRSQALRLHRKGDSAERIAEMLAVPRQEIDLLLKVHQLVLNNL